MKCWNKFNKEVNAIKYRNKRIITLQNSPPTPPLLIYKKRCTVQFTEKLRYYICMVLLCFENDWRIFKSEDTGTNVSFHCIAYTDHLADWLIVVQKSTFYPWTLMVKGWAVASGIHWTRHSTGSGGSGPSLVVISTSSSLPGSTVSAV